MNKAQKEVQQTQLNAEKKVIRLLERVYEQAKKDCEQKIRELSARTDMENLQFPMNLVNGQVKLAILTLSVRSMKLNTD